MRRYWYFYTGAGDETDPSNYTVVSGDPVNACTGGKSLCAIYALPNLVTPLLPRASEIGVNGILTAYIIQAKLISSSYPIGLQKAFAYTLASA